MYQIISNGLITIIDIEEAYALKLAEFFRSKSGLDYNIQVFTEINSLLEFNKTNYSDILIIAEVYGDYISDLNNAGHIYILSEGYLDYSLNNCSTIYKYQPAENIIRDVMTSYASISCSNPKIKLKNATANIISIYSPIKRCGKTTFALVLGCLLAKSENTLYLNFEEYSAFSLFTSNEHLGDLSDLLYFYMQNPHNLDKKLLSLSHSIHQLSYIPPMRFSLDFKSLTGDDWVKFINDIVSTERYKNIILDLSDGIIDVFGILANSNVIYFPTLPDSISNAKVENFKQTACLQKDYDFINKIKEIQIPQPNYSFGSNDLISNLLYNSFGSYISKLIEENNFNE